MAKLIYASLLVCFLLAFSEIVHAQDFSCLLTDPDGQPIPYASVHFPAQKRGALTKEDGTFTLNLDKGAENDVVNFSCLNYLPATRTVSSLISQAGTDCRIVLQEASYQLESAEVVAERLNLRRREIGVTGGINTAWFDFRSRENTIEIGTIMEIRERCRIDEVNIKIKDVEADSFLMEVSLYDYPVRRDTVGKMLLKEREIHTISREAADKTLTLDLRDQNIWVDKDFLVTFRMLRSGDSPGVVKMAARTKRGKGLITKGNGLWSDSYIYPTIWSEVSYLK